MTFEEYIKKNYGCEHYELCMLFGEDLEKAWNASAEAHKPRWIPVSERLPDIGQYVVVMADRYWNVPDGIKEMKVTATGYLSKMHDHKYWSIFGERGFELDAFTHWLELPEIPE